MSRTSAVGSKGTARLRGGDGGSTIERRAARAHRTLCGSGSYRQSIASSATRRRLHFGTHASDSDAHPIPSSCCKSHPNIQGSGHVHPPPRHQDVGVACALARLVCPGLPQGVPEGGGPRRRAGAQAPVTRRGCGYCEDASVADEAWRRVASRVESGARAVAATSTTLLPSALPAKPLAHC